HVCCVDTTSLSNHQRRGRTISISAVKYSATPRSAKWRRSSDTGRRTSASICNQPSSRRGSMRSTSGWLSIACATPRKETRNRRSTRRNNMTNPYAPKRETDAIVDESSILGKQGIEKTVAYGVFARRRQRQDLSRRRQPLRIRMALGKSLRLPLTFLGK